MGGGIREDILLHGLSKTGLDGQAGQAGQNSFWHFVPFKGSVPCISDRPFFGQGEMASWAVRRSQKGEK